MAYRFRRKEPVESAINRVAVEQLKSAIDTLARQQRGAHRAAVHEARKSVKKTRAALRLAHPKLDGAAARADRRLQKAGRGLSVVRDADVLVDTFDMLRVRYPARLRGAVFAGVRRALAAISVETRTHALDADSIEDAAESLENARQRTKQWRPDHGGFRALKPGLRSAFRRAKSALDEAEQHPTDEHFHTWRKRVKTHWYQMRLLAKIQPRVMNAYAGKLKRLERMLGDDHNLTVLKHRLLSLPMLRAMPVERARLVSLIEHFQSRLRQRSLSLGKVIYTPKPRAFTDRLADAWHAWRHNRRVPKPGAVSIRLR